MAKKQENKWLQIGNFLLGVDKNAHGAYVVLKAVSGQWSVRWSEESAFFAMILQVMKRAAENEAVKEYLHSLISVMFITTTYMHDLISLSVNNEMPFCEGVVKLFKEQNDFESYLAKKPTEKEDESALKEVAEMQEISDELEKLDKNTKI